MPKETFCLKIPKKYGEKAIFLTSKLGIIERELEIERNENFLYIPLTQEPSENELDKIRKQIVNSEISRRTFSQRKKQAKHFAEILEDKLAPHLLASLPKAMDIVGNIAIIEIPQELDFYKNLIGEAILKSQKNIRTVLLKASAIGGNYRTRKFSIIAGEQKTETIHKEHGCQFYVDLAKAYFSPRLSYEHKRVAVLVRDGETVIDMFAGVGPFAIQIAKTHNNVKVYAIDINPYAIEFLKKNIRLNKVEDKVYPILGDAKQVVKDKLVGSADRVIMNLPEKALEFVNAACAAIKPSGGVLHFYCFVNSSKLLEDMRQQFVEIVEKCGRKTAVLQSRFVRGTAPHEWQAVLDAKIFRHQRLM